MAAPPALTIAQVLADLSDLNVADPAAALALLRAPSSISPDSSTMNPSHLPRRSTSQNPLSKSSTNTSHPPSETHSPVSDQDPDSPSALQRMLSDTARENNIRMRFMREPSYTTSTLNRANSALQNNGKSSSPSEQSLSRRTSNLKSLGKYDAAAEPHLARAHTLLVLYEEKGRFEQISAGENRGLARAKKGVEEVRERYLEKLGRLEAEEEKDEEEEEE